MFMSISVDGADDEEVARCALEAGVLVPLVKSLQASRWPLPLPGLPTLVCYPPWCGTHPGVETTCPTRHTAEAGVIASPVINRCGLADLAFFPS